MLISVSLHSNVWIDLFHPLGETRHSTQFTRNTIVIAVVKIMFRLDFYSGVMDWDGDAPFSCAPMPLALPAVASEKESPPSFSQFGLAWKGTLFWQPLYLGWDWEDPNGDERICQTRWMKQAVHARPVKPRYCPFRDSARPAKGSSQEVITPKRVWPWTQALFSCPRLFSLF